MNYHEKIQYIELPAKDLASTKAFFTALFGWKFTEYGEEYFAFDYQGIEGGFFKSNQHVTTSNGSALIVFYSDSLETTLEKIQSHGGEIIKPIFSFPRGRRFHFCDPNKNEFAVWSDKKQVSNDY